MISKAWCQSTVVNPPPLCVSFLTITLSTVARRSLSVADFVQNYRVHNIRELTSNASGFIVGKGQYLVSGREIVLSQLGGGGFGKERVPGPGKREGRGAEWP